jgi:hypothetical protein
LNGFVYSVVRVSCTCKLKHTVLTVVKSVFKSNLERTLDVKRMANSYLLLVFSY